MIEQEEKLDVLIDMRSDPRESILDELSRMKSMPC